MKVTIFTDGSCLGNPGPGGYAAILQYETEEILLSKGYFMTTNNRMELLAAITALESVKKPSNIALYSDSQYVKQGITNWIFNWKRNNWQTRHKQPVKNVDLWKRLDAALKPHQIEWLWVRGHSGHPENERCDQLAKAGAMNPSENDKGYQPTQ